MTEIAFLEAVSSFIGGLGGLAVVPSSIGATEPAGAGDLPALVLSLEESERPRGGLGGGGTTIIGALPASTRLDLIAPNLPADGLTLLSPDRTQLSLFHGGQVRNDGTEAPLTGTDLAVDIIQSGQNPGDPDQVTSLVVVPGSPQAGEVAIVSASGRLTFGDALPATGTIEARYFIGQWTRTVERLRGVLRLDALAATPADAEGLSTGLVRILASPAARDAIERLVRLELLSLGSVGAPEAIFANARRRTARFSFEYERQLDVPASSGGVIDRVPVAAIL